MAVLKLRKKFTISSVLIIILLVLVVSVPSVLYWTIERNYMHARWETQIELAQTFDFYGVGEAQIALMQPNFTSDSGYRSAGMSGCSWLNSH